MLVAAAWPAGIAGWLAGWWPAVVLLGLAIIALGRQHRLVADRLRFARGSQGRGNRAVPDRENASRVFAPVASACVVAAAACAAAALAAAARDPPPEVVDRTVAITAAVRTTARQLQPQGGDEPSLMVAVRLTELRAGHRTWAVDLPGRVFVSASDWPADALPGAVVTGHGSIEARQPGDTEVLVDLASPALVVLPAEGWAATGNVFRAGLASAVAGADPDAASLVAGMTLGDESRQSPQFAEAMRAAGLAHLTAVSGGNIAIVLALVLGALRLVRAPPGLQWLGCAAALAGYVTLVGPQPSVIRAAAMGSAALLGILRGGPARGAGVLFGCVLLLLLFAPELTLSLGFALSVVATAGLLVLAPWVARGIDRVTRGRLPDPITLAASVAIAAQAATAPLLLAAGNPVTWLAVPANLVAAVAVTPVTALGLLAALVAPVAPAAAEMLGMLALPPATLVVHTANACQSAALSQWARDAPAWALAGLFAGAAIAVLQRELRRGRSELRRARSLPDSPQRSRVRPAEATVRLRPMAVAAALVALAGAVALAPVHPDGFADDWRLVACDVGQGTAILLRTTSSAVLVDTGPEGGGVGECLRTADLAVLDAVVLTHYHADHVGDLAAVLDGVQVGQVIVGPGAHPAEAAREVARLSAEHGVPVTTAAAGAQLSWPGLTGSVLWPRPGARGSAAEVNDSSLVLLTTWAAGGTALVPGDVEPASQGAIMAAWPAQRADVVVVPHHGSDHQDPRFAVWSGAATALASAGADNSYGHPAPETLREYEEAGAPVARTDVSGSVAVAWRNGMLEILPEH